MSKRQADPKPIFNILIDTCVWLDLAKDYQRQAVPGVLEELVRQNQVSLVLPRTVVAEFTRNKARVAEESGRSLSGVLKRAKEAVHRLGDAKTNQIVLKQLSDVDYKLSSLGEAAMSPSVVSTNCLAVLPWWKHRMK